MISYLNGIYILLIILSWSIFSYSYDWNYNFTVNNIICTNEKCQTYAKFIESSMNRNVDPCTDFYEFVCGRKKNPIPDYYPSWSTTIEMTIKSAADIRKILEAAPSTHDSTDLKKAKALYTACMELPSLGMVNVAAAQAYIQNAGYFPLFSESKSGSQKRTLWPEIHTYYSSLTGDAGLFQIFSAGQKFYHHNPLLHLTDVFTPFGKIVFKDPLTSSKKELYTKYVKAVLFSVFSYSLLKIYPKVFERRIQNIVNFRCEIHAIQALYPRMAYESQDNIMTIHELDNWYKVLSASEKVPMIPWVETFYSMYKQHKSEEEIKKMSISVVNKSYHQALMHLIHKTPSDVVVNHMHLYFIEKHLQLNGLLHDTLMETILVNGKLKGTIMYPGKKWHSCILSNSMSEAIGKAYIQKFFPPDKKRKIQDFATELKDVLVLQIQDSKWLDAILMNKFSHIAQDIKFAIGYPEFYDNEHLRSGYNPTVEPGNVEAFYCPNNNRLSISAAAFQLPLYDPDIPKTIVYGSIGMFISHELHHAYGPKAVASCYQFTIPPSKRLLYNERVECFLKKYHRLPVKEFKFLQHPPYIDGKRTLDENIADAMGLKLAYEAFRKDGWENGRCTLLPIYRGLTCEQLFFIAFGSVFCSDIDLEVMIEEVMLEDHSTARVRVNEAVANMKEFTRAFNCPAKAALNPVDKCDLWR